MQDKHKFRVDWATHEAAKYACFNWHYSKSIPAGKLVKVGAWENEQFIGVVIFARGATPNLGKPYGLDQDQCVELVRIALKHHKTPVSKIASIAIKWLKKSNPNIRLIVSFADQSQGHHGGIYQAGNWTYSGVGNPATFYKINGKVTHPRSIGSLGHTQNIFGAKKLDPNATSITVPGKHRYLMPLDDEMRIKISPLSKPYPKREKQAMPVPTEQRRCDTDPHAPIT
jgi:hypothetical protein